MSGYGHRLFVLLLSYQPRKLPRTGHVGTFAYVGEVLRLLIYQKGVQARQPHALVSLRQLSGRKVLQSLADGTDMFLIGTATASGDIEQSGLCHQAQMTGSIVWQFVVLAHFIGQSGIRIERQENRNTTRQLFHEGAQVRHAKRTVQAKA